MLDMNSMMDAMIALVYLIIIGVLSIPFIIRTSVYIIKFIVWLTKKNKF